MLEYVAMNVFYLSILIISQLVSQVISQLAEERFIVPSNNSKSLSYREGSKLSLEWYTSLDRIALTLWQVGNNSLEYIDNVGNETNNNSLRWTVFTEKQNINDTSTFFIAIFKPGETLARFSSGRFSILRASPVVSIVSASSVLTSSSSSSVPTSSSSSSVPTSSPSSLPSDSGLNSMTRAGLGLGLGLGLGIGIPSVLGLGIMLGYFLRSKRKNAAGVAGDDYHKPMVGDIGTLPSPQQTQGPIPMQELGLTERSELDSQALQNWAR